jgi:hypothetical protein
MRFAVRTEAGGKVVVGVVDHAAGAVVADVC